MAKPIISRRRLRIQFIRWLLEQEDRSEKAGQHRTHSWWQVMCLTGVDYFSTLGYQPGIAALAAGSLSPFATLILVLLTLFGALPIYRRVATYSPHGEGSISMLEHLLPWWQGKLFVLCLLGFVATDFIITITLSAADATAHIIENPLVPSFLHHQAIGITLVLVALLGAVFLRGFREAIGIAVFLVGIYLLLNFVVISVGLYQIFNDPSVLSDWQTALFAKHDNPLIMLGVAALLFPELALGLSGFETGVAVMPLVRGSSSDTHEQPKGRIRNTHNLLATAALIMSFFLLTSSLITILLIPAAEFQTGGKASGRALAYLAHQYLGDGFGTIYDLSTIAIFVTIIFKANVEAQGGAYATGVLVLITSAAFAVTLSAHRQRSKGGTLAFAIITLLFVYTTIINIIERPEGIRIATFFIAAIILTSLVSRVWRSTELRVERIEVDETASGFIAQERQGTIRLIAHRRNTGSAREYFLKEKEVREDHHIPPTDPILFLEIRVSDASEFAGIIRVKGEEVDSYRILRAESAAVPNAIAAILLYMRDETGKIPHAYFGWAEGNPIQYLLRFILFGEGDIAVVTREVLRKAEKNPDRRPAIHVGG